jgi:hypothetical protein
MPLSQFPKILEMLCGGYNVKATCLTILIWQNDIGRINILLFHFDDKKHISYYHASSALQDYLS